MEYFLYYCKFASIAVFHGLHTYTTCNNMWSIHTIANKFNYGGLPSKIHKGHKLKIKTLCALSHELLWWEHNTEAVPSPQWDVPPMLLSEKKKTTKKIHILYTSRPRWLSWMRCPTGDQEVAGSTSAEVGNILSWRLIMKYFLLSFSPFR